MTIQLLSFSTPDGSCFDEENAHAKASSRTKTFIAMAMKNTSAPENLNWLECSDDEKPYSTATLY